MKEEELKFYELVRAAYAEAMREGIIANAIVINEKMVKVPSFMFRDPMGGIKIAPTMYCGLHVHFTKDELPDNYSFALIEGPHNRLEQFESIGMEPEELKIAAELYRKIKEIVA